MPARMKDNDLVKNVMILFVVVLAAIVVLSIVLAILKALVPVLLLGAIVAGLVYLFRKMRA